MNMDAPFRLDTAAPARLAGSRCEPPVGLLNTYSTRNLGDAAIMLALTRLCPGRLTHAVIRDAEAVPVPGLSVRSDLSECHSFISVGGDIFNNARPWLVTRNFLRNVLAIKRVADRAIVFGQTVPASCGWLGLSLLASALRGTGGVVVRDRASCHLLAAKGIRAELSFDAAFTLRPAQPGLQAAARLYQEAGLQPERVALLSVRPFDALYPHDRNAFLCRMATLAALLLGRGHQVAVLIQADVDAHDGDRAVAAELCARVPDVVVLDCFAGAHQDDRVGLLIGALSIANIVVAVRYHAAVLRLAAGRRPYHLYYARKGEDLHARLGLAGGPLADFDPAAALAGIEATAMQDFDAAPLAADVHGAFSDAWEKLA